MKTPLVDEVVRYPKRIMICADVWVMPTRERQLFWVDVVARWHITDLQKFYESLSTVELADIKLNEIIYSEMRTVVAENDLPELVRDSNILLESSPEQRDDYGLIFPPENVGYELILKGRSRITGEILARSRPLVSEFGIELLDVVIRQIHYSGDLIEGVRPRY
jgi:membrane protease subunit HflC